MSRPVMLSNGQLMVGLDENGLVHDFYYPYVGLENLTNAHSVHHKIGVWVNDEFSWVDDDTWDISLNSESDALISDITMKSEKFCIELHFKDFIDHDHNSLIRRIDIKNTDTSTSDIRLFMHQVFQISRAGRADTALYDPDSNYILDYKGRYSLIISGQDSDKQSFDQFAVGNYAIEGKAGTFIDAEDGDLSGNLVEHGGVDSVIRFKFDIEANQSKHVDYWIIATASQLDSENIHNEYLNDGIDKREEKTRTYWSNWLTTGINGLHQVNKKYLEMSKKSLMIIKAHCDRRGGILASGDSSIFNYGRDYYCYCWPRDGAFALWPMIRLGYTEEPKKFFEFCRDTLDKDGYLRHKYQPDKSIGSTWHPLVHDYHRELAIQEDETAIILCMLGEFYDHSKDDEFVQSLYSTLIEPAAKFMSSFIDEATNLPHASYDLWEEKFLTTTYTVMLVEHALRRAAKFADLFEYPDDAALWIEVADKIREAKKLLIDPQTNVYRKGFHLKEDGALHFDSTVDSSSFYGALMFGDSNAESEKISSTVNMTIDKLLNKTSIGGVIRYENDWYMRKNDKTPPNPWFVCTLWLAQYYIQVKQVDKAINIVDWVIDHSIASGALSEQVDPFDGSYVGVTPLVWSHAEFINTILDITNE